MKMTVKLNIQDWPKRGGFSREQVIVDAENDTDAINRALISAKQMWPHGKVRAYDVIKPRLLDSTAIGSTLIGDAADSNAPLVIKRGPGRPPKVAV